MSVLSGSHLLNSAQLDTLVLMVTHSDRASADDRLVIKRFVEEEKQRRLARPPKAQ